MFRSLYFALLVACVGLWSSVACAQLSSGPAFGTVLEDHSLTDQEGNSQSLRELAAEGPVALIVIRSAGWCPQSKLQLLQIQARLKSIEGAGLKVAALSYDKPEVLKDFAALNGIQFPLFADPESKLIEKLGVINTSRKKGTIRYRVANPHTILFNEDLTVLGSFKGSINDLHDADQLLKFWKFLSPEQEREPKDIDLIRVEGNRFVDQSGTQIIFKGLAISDPDKIASDGHWNKEHFKKIKDWGVNLIRIPVNPSRYRKRGSEEYLGLLDDAVNWCSELNMHVIIDWHSIGNLRAGKFESVYYKTTRKETLEFWNTVSKRYAGNPTVAFYEVFNEPTLNKASCTWEQWKVIVEEIIDVIYLNDENVIPLVAGFNWAYDLQEIKTKPIERTGIAYVTHPYPGKCQPPREPHWEKHFGFLTSRFPVIATEIGYALESNDSNMVDKDGSYRKAILKYFDAKKISWCAWVFDPDWTPAMIKSYNYEPTHSGAFFRNAMQGK